MTELLYLACAAAFIVGLKRLASPRTARAGNFLAALGMLGTVVITLVDQEIVDWGIVIAGLVVGAAVGGVAAVRVKMTSMPEMVAAFNGFGGLASALVAMSEFLRVDDAGERAPARRHPDRQPGRAVLPGRHRECP